VQPKSAYHLLQAHGKLIAEAELIGDVWLGRKATVQLQRNTTKFTFCTLYTKICQLVSRLGVTTRNLTWYAQFPQYLKSYLAAAELCENRALLSSLAAKTIFNLEEQRTSTSELWGDFECCVRPSLACSIDL